MGTHQFDFQITDTFFEAFEFSRTQKGMLNLKLILDKTENMLQLQFQFQGNVWVVCDRCGEDFEYPLLFDEALIVKFSDREQESDTDEVIFLPSSTYQIKLAQYIYEYINLALPMRLTHPEDENGEPQCPVDAMENLNDIESTDDEVDPRWEALKKLK